MVTTTSIGNSLIPSDLDVSMARESSRLLDELHLEDGQALDLQIGGKAVSLPASVARMLLGTLHDLAAGKALAVVPLDEEVTPNEAADLLNVSRGFVIKLIERGELPARMVGTHHRIRLADAVAYKLRNDVGRRKAVAQLVADGQELDMGY